VRAAADAYLGALQAGDWARACRLMTDAARLEVADATGGTCAEALADGAAGAAAELESARRELPGVDVRLRGASATLGPLGTAQGDLRLRRTNGRWLVGD
jgi:hypothetical protein